MLSSSIGSLLQFLRLEVECKQLKLLHFTVVGISVLQNQQKQRDMSSIRHLLLSFFFLFSLTLITTSQGRDEELHYGTSKASSQFEAALDTLQKRIGYKFQRINLLRRAMTHPSYSGENNKALSILGLDVLETSISLRCLVNDIDVSAKELNNRITKISEMDSCANEALRLGLDKIIRVSSKTNSSIPPVVCGGFRAFFGAVAVDSGKADDAGNLFLSVHRGGGVRGGIAAFAF
ncbi:Ribonuclease III domain [Macleaya cordata]|uniref:Ribonuclease III domain n=1 Tax=Macleaya cordata TaxID=56857 RepID=A0A200PZT3_MACCD|nr:Ribonuclease III domain [Macleaya cordata]